MAARRSFGLGAIDVCPECGSDRLRAIRSGDDANFFCESCSSCWHLSMGWVRRVDPLTCPGCARRSECLARLAVRGETVDGAVDH
jgi:hypothetical protein